MAANSRSRTRSRTAAKSSATKPNTRSATKNKEDTALSTSNPSTTNNSSNDRKSRPKRTAFEKAVKLLSTENNNSSNTDVVVVATNNNKSTKQRAAKKEDGRSTQKRKDDQSVFATNQYAESLEKGGANMNAVATNIELQTLRASGCEGFKVDMLVHNGEAGHIVKPKILKVKQSSSKLTKFLQKGYEPQVPVKKLSLTELVSFNTIEFQDTPKDQEEPNIVQAASLLEITSNSKVSKETSLTKKILPRNGFIPSYKNEPWFKAKGSKGVTKDQGTKNKRGKQVFFKKGCCTKHQVSFFGKKGRTLRKYYVREGKWNRQYIESLGKSKKTEQLLKALLYEEDVKDVAELF